MIKSGKCRAMEQIDAIIADHIKHLEHPANARPSAQRAIKRDLSAAKKAKAKLAKDIREAYEAEDGALDLAPGSLGTVFDVEYAIGSATPPRNSGQE